MKYLFGNIETPFALSAITENMIAMYSNFNKEIFDKDIEIIYDMKAFNDLIYSIFDCEYSYAAMTHIEPHVMEGNDKDVVLLFSGGLDSCFQALVLKQKGYNPILLHARNLNQYENNVISNNPVRSFASKHGFELVEINIWHNQRTSNPSRKFWSENPIKNQMLISIAIDYCIANKMNTISLGDDNNLRLEDTVKGVNTTDAREVLDAALEGFKALYPNLNIITIDDEYKGDKEIRLKMLYDNNSIDDFSSCVGPGRLIASQNTRYRSKFGIELPRWNCCSCRKCCMHLLIMHYSSKFNFVLDQPVLDRCWDKLANSGKGADYNLFNSSIPLETRIKTLFDY